MRPSAGVFIELLCLAAIFGLGSVIPHGAAGLAYVLGAQFLATYLIHCPAHYVVGSLLGIRFRQIRLGRSTLSRAVPKRFKKVAGLMPIATLLIDKDSLAAVSKSSASAMYLSGTVASSASAILIAIVVTASGSWVAIVLTWTVAIGYLLFDVVFSPRSGDVMRARAVSAPG